MKSQFLLVLAALPVAFCCPIAAVGAAEIHLRSQAAPQGNLVVLGDVADVFASEPAEADRLRRIELTPAPAPGAAAFLPAREVQEMLHLRGLNLAEHRFSGASQVEIAPRVAPKAAPKPRPVVERLQRLDPGAVRLTQAAVADAVAKHLNQAVKETRAWQVKLELDEAQARVLAASNGLLQVTGGQAPWTGVQQFDIHTVGAAGAQRVTVMAEVSLPASVVVTLRPLARGAVVQASDVELRPHQPVGYDATVVAYHTLEEVVGQETTRSLAEGQVLGEDHVQAPILVRNGEVVTVYARSAGIQVRTAGRAREDGGHGDLIWVEGLKDRKRFQARVASPQTVEVYARATQVSRDAQGRESVAFGPQK